MEIKVISRLTAVECPRNKWGVFQFVVENKSLQVIYESGNRHPADAFDMVSPGCVYLSTKGLMP